MLAAMDWRPGSRIDRISRRRAIAAGEAATNSAVFTSRTEGRRRGKRPAVVLLAARDATVRPSLFSSQAARQLAAKSN